MVVRGACSATRALRLLLLLVVALAMVEYLFEGILISSKWSPLRSYLYTPAYIATQSTIRSGDKISINWTKLPPTNENPIEKNMHVKKNTLLNTNESQSVIEKMLEDQKNGTKNETDHTGQSVKKSPTYSGTSLFITKIRNLMTNKEVVRKTKPTLHFCPKVPPGLGPMSVNQTELELDFVESNFPEIQFGGRYAPPNCTARHKVAIIVPYRDRRQHLPIFLNHMHPFLMKQQIEYGIFIVEQEGKMAFNRGKLMNVGFAESLRLDSGWQCFVFHDIDLLPLDTRNLYTCPRQPRHMSVCVSTYHYKLPYDEIFGGVSALTLEQFTKVNGFSNKYWGWGGEDDDLSLRLVDVDYHLARYKMSIARYLMLGHKAAVPNKERHQILEQTHKIFTNDGLSTLEYRLEKVVKYHLYTHILVNIDSPQEKFDHSWWTHFTKFLVKIKHACWL